MASKSVKGAHTPENMTEIMVRKLEDQICRGNYPYFSNAYLATLEGCRGPVWCIDLYKKNGTKDYAILEEVSPCKDEPRAAFITKVLRPHLLADENQIWFRKIKRKGKWIRQQSEIFFNCKMELCIRWKTLTAED